MANEKKNNKQPLGIPQTKGSFALAGYVSGVDSERFFTEKNTKNGDPRRTLNFAVVFDKDKKSYVEANGMPSKSVWFSKTETDPSGKKTTQTIEVPWSQRNEKRTDGFQIIGTRVGIEPMLDENGVERNKQVITTAFDACKYAAEHLKDDMPVYVRGNIEFSTYQDRHFKRFSLNQISRMKKAPDFEASDFESTNNFTQQIVFMGIEPNEDKSKFILSAKIVGYNTIEDTEFVVENPAFAKLLKKNLKMYDAIEVFGKIDVEKNESEIEVDDGWGKNPMRVKNSPTIVTLKIIGADKESIDHDIYSEENISEAIRIANSMKNSKNDFGDNDDDDTGWGSKTKFSNDDSDDDSDDEW